MQGLADERRAGAEGGGAEGRRGRGGSMEPRVSDPVPGALFKNRKGRKERQETTKSLHSSR